MGTLGHCDKPSYRGAPLLKRTRGVSDFVLNSSSRVLEVRSQKQNMQWFLCIQLLSNADDSCLQLHKTAAADYR